MYLRIILAVTAVLTLLFPCAAAGEGYNDLTMRYKIEAFRYYTGTGRPVDLSRARGFYTKAALRGDAEAQFVLGGMLFKGEGGEVDQRAAFRWLLKAAENGKVSAESMQIIGSMYLRGENVPQNYKEAKHWLSRASDMDNLAAANDLAFIYYNGLDGRPEPAKALSLYTRAALQGDATAQANVGMMHATGTGTQVDTATAYAWYSLAASGGNTAAIIQRNNLMADMSWEELNRAQAISIQLYREISRLDRVRAEKEQGRR